MQITKISTYSTLKVCFLIGIISGVVFDLYAWGLCSYLPDSEEVAELNESYKEAQESGIANVPEEQGKPGTGSIKLWSTKIVITKVGIRYEGIWGEIEASKPIFFIVAPVMIIIRVVIFGVIFIAIYNIAANVVGGIKFSSNRL